jgi:Sulfotransferase domain
VIYFFPHIPKAGGTTLKQFFYKKFGRGNTVKVWDPNFGADVSKVNFEDFEGRLLINSSAVVGHLPVHIFMKNQYMKDKYNAGKVKIITTVRNPIERMVSLYNFVSLNEIHPNHEKVKAADPLEFMLKQQSNFQYNFLKFDKIDSVDEIFDVMEVCSTENSIKFFGDFFRNEIDFNLEDVQIKNKTSRFSSNGSLFGLDEIPSDVIEELSDKHSLDLALYERSKAY